MIINKTVIQTEINERVYELFLDPNSPLGEIHDALCSMKSLIIEKMREIDEQSKKQKEESIQKEESV